MKMLIGHTGFVGSNLHRQHAFDAVFHSKNIADAYGTRPNLCVYAGVRGEKFRADRFPKEDFLHIREALDTIKRIAPRKLVLISTIDVIPGGLGRDIFEDTPYHADTLAPYGKHRLFLENAVREQGADVCIVRLPGLFGPGIKKNFIYDLIQFIPSMLKQDKFEELCGRQAALKAFYAADENGFFRLRPDISAQERVLLKEMFAALGFSALHFTDSRSQFSFYNLEYLWAHIELLLAQGIELAHMATEPVPVADIYERIYGAGFVNEVSAVPFDHTFFKTKYAEIFGGHGGYIFDRDQVVSDIVQFVGD